MKTLFRNFLWLWCQKRSRARRAVAVVPPSYVALAPDQVVGLKLWLTAESLALSDEDPVAEWSDSGTGGYSLTQPFEQAQPIFKTNQVNGYPVVRFDGVDDCLVGVDSILFAGQSFTIFMVRSPVGASSALALAPAGTTNQEAVMERGVLWHHAAWGVYTFRVHPAVPAGFFVHCGVWSGDPDGLRNWINGVESEVALQRMGEPGHFSMGDRAVSLGARAGMDPFGGDMAMVLIYEGELAEADRRGVEMWLGQRYGIEV